MERNEVGRGRGCGVHPSLCPLSTYIPFDGEEGKREEAQAQVVGTVSSKAWGSRWVRLLQLAAGQAAPAGEEGPVGKW